MTIDSILSSSGGLTPAVLASIDATVASLTDELHAVSQTLHDNPELAWEEHLAHDTGCALMEKKGWKVTRGAHGLPTAWRAEWDNGPGPTIGFNSEMDALRGIGHACGHNLIFIVGIAGALATAAFMKENGVPGKVVLLGTPAEEAGGGKVVLLERGAYDGMDVCLMSHPMAEGNGAGIPFCACIAAFTVTFKGASAHAAANPSGGVNALDAAVAAYTNIALLRQQIPDPARIHLTLKGSEGWSANVIAAHAQIQMGIRAPSAAATMALIPRALNAARAGALATGCEIEIRREITYLDTRHSEGLAQYLEQAVGEAWGDEYGWDRHNTPGSTDFGNVCYTLPALHPHFRLPDCPKGTMPRE
jgi:amidohydrolase